MASSRLLSARVQALTAVAMVVTATVIALPLARQQPTIRISSAKAAADALPNTRPAGAAMDQLRLEPVRLWQPLRDPPPPPPPERAPPPPSHALIAVVSRDGAPAAILQAKDGSGLVTLAVGEAQGGVQVEAIEGQQVTIRQGDHQHHLELAP